MQKEKRVICTAAAIRTLAVYRARMSAQRARRALYAATALHAAGTFTILVALAILPMIALR
jgi:hypothetical protein